MAEILLLHSVLGLRQAERDIASVLEGDGHRVTVPDLYEGRRTDDYDEGFRIQEGIGADAIAARARTALAALPPDTVLAGVSFGAFLIGRLWSERPAMPAAVLLCGFAPWMSPRREGLRVSAHIARPDPFDDEEVFAGWAAESGGVALDLYRYDGAGHYFLDRSLPDYDAAAAALCLGRVRRFLGALGA
jgi:dienelactone hydrolase